MTLQDMYKALRKPEQLKGWKAEGGDPCDESWTGIECSASSVIHIKLHGLELSGSLGSQLANLYSLKNFKISLLTVCLFAKIRDVSLNKISGEIPFGLPPNVTRLNLSHNILFGPIGDVFVGLQNLKEMDLSYNKFSGNLPSSFATLTNLSRLFLQNNDFAGSVVFLADLQLTDLNIQDNNFSGIIPQHFQTIPNLWIGGNKFDVGSNYAPWDFPFDKVPEEQNIASPPTIESSAIEKYPSKREEGHKKGGLAAGAIVVMVGGIALLAGLLALAIVIRLKQTHAVELDSMENSIRSTYSIPFSSSKDTSPGNHEEIQQLSAVGTIPAIIPRSMPVRYTTKDRASRRSFSRKYKMPPTAKLYALAELQLATHGFSEQKFLGEGSLGSVYKAEFPDGQVLAVKNVNMVSLSLYEEERFLDVVRVASRLKHPHIVRLVGYCVEHGQHLLVYEYVRNLTLDEALHCEFFLPLTWGIRIQIAIGVARALDYMHSISPPVAHCNLKAANILLDDELMPQVCDCGLSVLRPLTTNDVKLKASEMAISNSGYIAPEHGQLGTESTKADVYAFGVLLLELLTGKKPFDSSRPYEEQSLVKWASCRLHDASSLEEMVDPGLRRSFTTKALSRYADAISLCVQPEREFRAPMSEVLVALTSILPKPGADTADADAFERSFRSTHTRFVASPAMTYVSI
ncbi:hypothetical protein Cgig2_031877 [Carnegiea gigantea]|uniref:Protein kinase domain-containing protein n=1 Tax=Carnegiea gigantea TaxID=171969 RepID=A0A9Q1QMI1_9CARY|nr:hypothetical protein Cgig2_031877 [Carnegiea gigantea]